MWPLAASQRNRGFRHRLLNHTMPDAPALIARLLADPRGPEVGRIANDLLSAFWAGHPLGDLRPLLRHPDREVFGAGLFVLSELGKRGRPLRDELPRLLAHPWPRARHEAVESAMCATVGSPDDGPILAAAYALATDPHPAVRDVAQHALTVASDAQCRAALAHLEGTDLADPREAAQAAALRWLLGPQSRDAARVIAWLDDGDPLHRQYALAAASRLAAEDRSPLAAALASPDADLRAGAEFAERLADLMAHLARRARGSSAGPS